jgi:hypothetical protein
MILMKADIEIPPNIDRIPLKPIGNAVTQTLVIPGASKLLKNFNFGCNTWKWSRQHKL